MLREVGPGRVAFLTATRGSSSRRPRPFRFSWPSWRRAAAWVARRPVPIDALAVRSAAGLFVLLAACQAPAPPPGDGGPRAALAADAGPDAASADPSAGGPSASSTAWSRDALAPRSEASARQGPPVLGPANQQALEEIVAAQPDAGRRPTGEDGGTRIGTDTGVPPDREPAPAAEPGEPPRGHVAVGAVKMVGRASTPAIEKAARAQLYWTLVQRCRGPDGAVLPPDSITLAFNLDAEGYLIPSSILATAGDPRHEEAAACMRRELSGLSFRSPAGARGQPTRVEATVPSVD